jgi:hypothetical protein
MWSICRAGFKARGATEAVTQGNPKTGIQSTYFIQILIL